MKMLAGYFPISLPTKPYLKPYLETLYGNPVIINTQNTFGVIVHSLLTRPRRLHEKKEIISYRVFDKFDTQMKVYLPKWWLEKYEVGHTLEEEQIISLNKFFEERFEEDLTTFCKLSIVYKVEIKKSLEDFCMRHRIEIEEHITYDALKQKEYRARKASEKMFFNNPAELSSENSTHFPSANLKKKSAVNPAELSCEKRVEIPSSSPKKKYQINTAELSPKKVAFGSFHFS